MALEICAPKPLNAFPNKLPNQSNNQTTPYQRTVQIYIGAVKANTRQPKRIAGADSDR